MKTLSRIAIILLLGCPPSLAGDRKIELCEVLLAGVQPIRVYESEIVRLRFSLVDAERWLEAHKQLCAREVPSSLRGWIGASHSLFNACLLKYTDGVTILNERWGVSGTDLWVTLAIESFRHFPAKVWLEVSAMGQQAPIAPFMTQTLEMVEAPVDRMEGLPDLHLVQHGGFKTHLRVVTEKATPLKMRVGEFVDVVFVQPHPMVGGDSTFGIRMGDPTLFEDFGAHDDQWTRAADGEKLTSIGTIRLRAIKAGKTVVDNSVYHCHDGCQGVADYGRRELPTCDWPVVMPLTLPVEIEE